MAESGDPTTPWPPAGTRRAVRRLARHPDLWTTALRTGWRLAAPGWWRRWPPVPRLPRPYEEFRRQTMFGSGPRTGLDGEDLVAYLKWCRRMRALG